MLIAVADWPVLAAAIGGPILGAVVGVAGILAGLANSRGEREHTAELSKAERVHTRLLARDARLYEDLKAAYFDTMAYLDIIRGAVRRAEPVASPQDPPPSLPSDEAARALWARVGSVGSEEIVEALRELAQIASEFYARVGKQQVATANELVEIERARSRYYEKVIEIERLIRAELRA